MKKLLHKIHGTNLKKNHGQKLRITCHKFDELTAQKLGIATSQIRRKLMAQKLEKAAAQNPQYKFQKMIHIFYKNIKTQ